MAFHNCLNTVLASALTTLIDSPEEPVMFHFFSTMNSKRVKNYCIHIMTHAPVNLPFILDLSNHKDMGVFKSYFPKIQKQILKKSFLSFPLPVIK